MISFGYLTRTINSVPLQTESGARSACMSLANLRRTVNEIEVKHEHS